MRSYHRDFEAYHTLPEGHVYQAEDGQTPLKCKGPWLGKGRLADVEGGNFDSVSFALKSTLTPQL